MKKNILINTLIGFGKVISRTYSRFDCVSIACRLRVLAILVACLTMFGVGNAWGADGDDAYKITFSKLTTGTNYNNYSAAHTVTVSTKSWSVQGNQGNGDWLQVGGNTLDGTPRTITGSSTIDAVIKKVQVNHSGITGSSGHNLTVDSAKLDVSSDNSFTSIVETVKVTGLNLSASSSASNISFTPAGTHWASGKYYKITIWCSNSSTSKNGGLKVTSIQFIEGTACNKSVTVSNGNSSTNGTITSITTSPVATCSSTASDRRVSILVTPSTGYVAPTDLSVGTTTGTVNSSKVSRTDNGNGTFTFVYGYNQNDNGTISYNAACVGKQCTVTFDKNSGTGGDNSVTATYGSAMTSITPPTREHYDFAGYYDSETNNDGTGNKYYNSDGTSATNWNKNTTANTTLYAKWTEHSLTNYRTVCCTDAGLAYGTGSVEKTFGDGTFTNTLTNSHSVSVSYESSDTDVATVAADGTVTIKGAGTTTITASSANQTVSTVSYCADEASYTLTVNKAAISPTLTYSPNSVVVGENSATPTVGSNPGSGGVTYAITSATPSGCATINTSTGVVTGVAVGSVTVTATVGATDNYNGNTATATVTIKAASCDNYSFHTKNSSSEWNADPICFSKVGDSHLWRTEELALPTDGVSFKVGWKGSDHWDNARTNEKDWQYMVAGPTTTRSGGGYWSVGGHLTAGNTGGALGYFYLYDNSSDDNKYVGFTPSGYVFRWGTDGDGWTSKAFIPDDEDDIDEEEWNTELVTWTSDNAADHLYVGLKTSSGYIWTNHSEEQRVIFLTPGVWAQDDCKFGLWDKTHTAWRGFMQDEDGDGIYEGTVPSNCTEVTFARFDKAKTEPVWDQQYNKSSDQTISSLTDKNMFSVTGWGDGTYCAGNWNTLYERSGVFHINAGSNLHNWDCLFVPHNVLSYDKNDGGASGTMSVQSVAVNAASNSVSVAANGFDAPTGYHFDHWDAAPDGSGSDYNPNDSYTLSADATLYAIWAPNTNTAYTVKHYKQKLDGTYDASPDETDNLTGTTGASVTPDRKSYTGFMAPSGQTVTILADGSRVVEYQYSRNSYNLTWSLDGGSISVAGTTAGSVKYGASLTAPTVTKTGYTFASWSPAVPSTMPAEDATYTATWTAKQCTVTFDKNGGSGGDNSVTATYDAAMTTITPPTRSGYTFDGYWDEETDNDGSGNMYYNANGTSAATWNKNTTSETTLYAKWIAKTDVYKSEMHTGVTAWSGYASGVNKNGAGYTIPNPGDIAVGDRGTDCEGKHYHFAGWVTDANKEAGTISGNIIAATGTTDATGTTYWAVWEKEKAGSTGVPSYQKVTSTENITSDGRYLIVYEGTGGTNNPCAFDGNLATLDASHNKVGSLSISSSTIAITDGNRTNLANAEFTIDLSNLYIKSHSNKYIDQSSWANGLESNISETAVHSIGFDESDNFVVEGKGYDENTSSYVVLRFNKTYDNSNDRFRFYKSGQEAIALYKYDPGVYYEDPKVECVCSANPSAGTAAVDATGTFSASLIDVNATSASTGHADCSYTDYGFVWSSSETTPTLIEATGAASTNCTKVPVGTSGEATSFTGSLTGSFSAGNAVYFRSYAKNDKADGTFQYSSVVTITPRSVTFNLNGHGSSAPAAQFVNNGSKATDPSYSESVTGYIFGGWYKEAGCSNAWNFASDVASGENKTLYAKWTPITYSVRFNDNDENYLGTATGSMSNESFTYDEDKALTTNAFSLAGYDFAGWALTANGDVAYTDGASASNLSSTNEAIVDLYAIWTAKSYDVTLAATNETSSVGEQVVTATYNDDMPTVKKGGGAVAAPTRTGYTFTGWEYSSTTYYNYNAGTSTLTSNHVWDQPNSTTTLTPKWSINSYTLTWDLAGGTVATAGTGASAGATGSPSSSVEYNSAITAPTVTKSGYNFAGWDVDVAATMPAAATTYTATWTAKTLNSISLAEDAVTIYDQQYVLIDVIYDPADILTKGYTLVSSPTKVVTTNSTNAQLKLSATKAGVVISETVSETISIQAKADGTKTTSVTVTINPLPRVHFKDLIHGETFSDAVATISDNALAPNKTTPTHDDLDEPGSGNRCEKTHLHLVGWIRSDYEKVVNYMNGTGDAPTVSELENAGTGYWFTPNADINVLTYDGKTFYAVWAVEE